MKETTMPGFFPIFFSPTSPLSAIGFSEITPNAYLNARGTMEMWATSGEGTKLTSWVETKLSSIPVRLNGVISPSSPRWVCTKGDVGKG